MSVKDDPRFEELVRKYIAEGLTPNRARKKAFRTITRKGIL